MDIGTMVEPRKMMPSYVIDCACDPLRVIDNRGFFAAYPN